MNNTYNPEQLLKAKRDQILGSISVQGVSEVDSLLKSLHLPTKSDVIEKSLVQKHIQIHGKNGKTYNAIRWVNPDTGLSNHIHHPKYSNESVLEGNTDVEKIHNVINHPTMSPVDKTRHLISMGIYDKKHLDELSEQKYKESQNQLREAGIHNYKEYMSSGANVPVLPSPGAEDLHHPEAQLKAVSDIQTLLGRKEATKYQQSLKKDLIEKYGITVDDKWNGYENDLNMLLDGDLGLRAVMAYGTGGVGKATPLYSKVLTPYGFKTMGEMQYGDIVFCPDGTESRVVGVYPQGIRPVYELTFKDGRKVRCDLEHLWKVKVRGSSYNWKVLPLSEIMKSTLKLDNLPEYRFGVPLMQKPFQNKNRGANKLLIDPWLLGYLLGDGCLSTESDCVFTVGDRDRDFILNKVNSIIGYQNKVVYRGQFDYAIVKSEEFKLEEKSKKTDLSLALTKYQLRKVKSHTKFIPKPYFSASAENKLELVRGLMDSDGYVSEDGFCFFDSVSEELANQFLELVYSLGARFGSVKKYDCNVKNGTGQPYYEVTFMMQNGVIPVSLPFKLERIQNKEYPIDSLSIVDIQYIGEEETQCILIDHPEHLYITDNYIVTHNTFVLENKILPERKMIEYDPELDMAKNESEYDYVKIGGKIGSRETQRYMYEHRNKILIFDDCDSMWNDDGLINVLKNVLDTSGQGKCQWAQRLPETSKGAGDEVPSTFKFSGRMIFITNLTKDELAERGASPITNSRAASSDLTMNMTQTIEKMEKIVEHITLKDENREVIKDVTIEDKLAGLKAIKEVSHLAKIEDLNTRVLTGIIAHARRMRKTTGKYDERGLIFVALKQFGLT